MEQGIGGIDMEQEVKVYNARKIVELIAQDIRQVMFKMAEIEEIAPWQVVSMSSLRQMLWYNFFADLSSEKTEKILFKAEQVGIDYYREVEPKLFESPAKFFEFINECIDLLMATPENITEEEFDKWARHIPKPEHSKKGITVTCTTIPQTISNERIWDLSNQELFRKELNCYKFVKPSKKAEA